MDELKRIGTNIYTNVPEMVEIICDRKLDENNIIQINAPLDKIKRNALPSPQQGSCGDDKDAKKKGKKKKNRDLPNLTNVKSQD